MFWFSWKLAFLPNYHYQYFCTPTSRSKMFWYTNHLLKTLWTYCGYKSWIGGWGVCKLWKNNRLILLISIQNLYFGDGDAIYDVIIEEPVWKWRHIYKHEISRDPFAESVLFQIYSAIFIFRQIDRANCAVRGPSSFAVRGPTSFASCKSSMFWNENVNYRKKTWQRQI